MKKTSWACVGLLVAAVTAPGAGLRNPHVRDGLELSAQGAAVVVAPGACEINGQVVRVAVAIALPVAPGPVVSVTNDPLPPLGRQAAGLCQGHAAARPERPRCQRLRLARVRFAGSAREGWRVAQAG